jgi:hypothetical protein
MQVRAYRIAARPDRTHPRADADALTDAHVDTRKVRRDVLQPKPVIDRDDVAPAARAPAGRYDHA